MAKLEKNTNQGRISESVIGSGMEIVGDIKCNGIMRVVGKLKGTINCSELIIEEDANVNATIAMVAQSFCFSELRSIQGSGSTTILRWHTATHIKSISC